MCSPVRRSSARTWAPGNGCWTRSTTRWAARSWASPALDSAGSNCLIDCVTSTATCTTCGKGVFRSIEEALGGALAGARVLIQGFGVVGCGTAWHLDRAGAKIVGVSDGEKAILRPEGLDVELLMKARGDDGLLASERLPDTWLPSARDDLLAERADVLVLAAGSYLVDGEIAFAAEHAAGGRGGQSRADPGGDRCAARTRRASGAGRNREQLQCGAGRPPDRGGQSARSGPALGGDRAQHQAQHGGGPQDVQGTGHHR